MKGPTFKENQENIDQNDLICRCVLQRPTAPVDHSRSKISVQNHGTVLSIRGGMFGIPLAVGHNHLISDLGELLVARRFWPHL